METMTYKEKILAEIERLKHYGNIPYDRDMFEGVCLIESFINSLPAEKPSEELEEVADCYLENIKPVGFMEGDYDGSQILDTFRAGANWQKEQMMKSAIDAIVDEDIENSYIKTLVFFGEQRNALHTRISNYEFGETVKIIIIKEDEQ